MKKHAAWAVLVVWAIGAGQASAQWESVLNFYNANLPYFSQHPPVYFSLPMQGPNASSAAASSLEMFTPNQQVKPATPLVMRNPYVAWPSRHPGARAVASQAALDQNPYVTLAGSTPPAPPAPIRSEKLRSRKGEIGLDTGSENGNLRPAQER